MMTTDTTQTNLATKVSSAEQWRALHDEGEIVEFPSGLSARVRPAGLTQLFLAGKIPDSLLRAVARLTHQEGLEPVVGPDLDVVRANITEVAELLDILSVECFLEPKCVRSNPAPDQITVKHLSFEDQEFLLRYSQAPARTVRTFRLEQTLINQSLPNGEGFRDAAKRDFERFRSLGSVPTGQRSELLGNLAGEQVDGANGVAAVHPEVHDRGTAA
jgi:hypothetical protein